MRLQLGGERIRTTVEHPFWVADRGWVKTGELRLGDRVSRADGAAVPVTEIEHQTEFEGDQLPLVYNIEVAEWHSYLVGKWMWWVHNADPCLTKPIEILLKARTYLREVERITKLKVHPSQIKELKNALRSKKYEKLTAEATKKSRKAFNSKKDAIISKWEQQTGQKWPTYSKDVLNEEGKVIRKAGDKYDAHHIIENTHGGDHEWWNVHPARFSDQHQGGIHGKGGPASKMFGN